MASSGRRARTNVGATNLATRRSRSRSRSYATATASGVRVASLSVTGSESGSRSRSGRPFTADAAMLDERMRETATWKKTPVPSPATWVSISKEPLWQGRAMEFESLQQARSDRLQTFVEQERQLQLSNVKKKLAAIATAKFGSVPAMFEAFGLAEDDIIHLDQMTKLFTKHRLDEQIPRPDQRLLLDFANHHLEHARVRQILEFMPQPEPTQPVLDPKVQVIRADIAERFVESRQAQKLPTDTLFLKRALLDEFRLIDDEQNGYVTEQQVLHVFGPERLNLGVPETQVQEIVRAVGQTDTGKVRYGDLVRFLDVEDKTSLFSPYFDMRAKVHTMHKSNVEIPWPFMKETEELLQLGLAREQEAFIKQANPSDELARTRVIPFEQGVPFHLRPHTVHSHVPVKGNQHSHEEQPRRVTTAGEIFEDIDRAQTAHQRTRPIIRSPQLSLWDDDSSVDVADHYRTMTDEYFSPLSYSPITTFTRETPSDAERGARKREKRRRARYRRVDEYIKITRERQHMDDLATRMNDHQRVTNLSEHMLRNAEIVSASDELREKRQPYGYPTRRFMLEQHMTTLSGSRDGLARYLRDVKEDRDFCTVYSKDFSSHALVES